MPRSESTFSLLADIATIRGRVTEAAHLRDGADWQRRNDPDPPQVVRDALAEMQALGRERAVANALRKVPRDVRLLIEQELVDIPTAARLASAGIVTLADLQAAMEGHPELVPPSVDEAARAALPGLRAARTPVPLGRAWGILDDLLAVIRETGPEVERAEAVGSTRRFATFSGDLELLVSSSDPAPPPHGSRHCIRNPRVMPRRYESSLPSIDLRSAFTSSRRTCSLRRCSTSPDRGHTWRQSGRVRPIAGSVLAGIRPRRAGRPLRRRRTSMPLSTSPTSLPSCARATARSTRRLPVRCRVLLTVGDMRGDLHMHTDWSDGRDSIDVMVDAAEALGYEYVAMTDHSKSSAIARGLDADRLAQQRDAIAAARERHPRITILHGAEVDILRDGSLDFPDDVLETSRRRAGVPA